MTDPNVVDGLNRIKLLVAHRLDANTAREVATLANAAIAALAAAPKQDAGAVDGLVAAILDRVDVLAGYLDEARQDDHWTDVSRIAQKLRAIRSLASDRLAPPAAAPQQGDGKPHPMDDAHRGVARDMQKFYEVFDATQQPSGGADNAR